MACRNLLLLRNPGSGVVSAVREALAALGVCLVGTGSGSNLVLALVVLPVRVIDLPVFLALDLGLSARLDLLLGLGLLFGLALGLGLRLALCTPGFADNKLGSSIRQEAAEDAEGILGLRGADSISQGSVTPVQLVQFPARIPINLRGSHVCYVFVMLYARCHPLIRQMCLP